MTNISFSAYACSDLCWKHLFFQFRSLSVYAISYTFQNEVKKKFTWNAQIPVMTTHIHIHVHTNTIMKILEKQNYEQIILRLIGNSWINKLIWLFVFFLNSTYFATNTIRVILLYFSKKTFFLNNILFYFIFCNIYGVIFLEIFFVFF